MIEDKRIEAFELRKNKDNNRKFNKQVKELRKAEGAQSRKAQISEVSNLRKEGSGEDGGASKEERLNKIIESGPATKSKKRVNMVSVTHAGTADAALVWHLTAISCIAGQEVRLRRSGQEEGQAERQEVSTDFIFVTSYYL